jgi:hypothetical protein
MGAYVVPVRESSMQTEIVIADDPTITDGVFAAPGWSTPSGPLAADANPFTSGEAATLPAGATASWTLTVPTPGEYDVYVAWVQGPDRSPNALYTIHHAGGESEVRVDQRRHGSTWVLLGRWSFDAVATVTLSANSPVSADAVRLGGGLGHVDRGGGTDELPAFEVGARYAAQWNGAPADVWDYSDADGNDDVGTRSRFSAWDHEDGEDAVYVAWHTNAPSPARGTSSFAYGPSAFGPLSEFSGVPGSLELMDAIHTELVADLRAAWQPDWQDRAQHTAYFGEVNPSHNPEMPATLIEVAFHDTLEDAEALRDPRFRRIAARAIAQGIARYFANRDGIALTLPSESPTAVRVRGATLSWDPPDADPAGGDAPTGYRVYLSRDGRAFDDGVDVSGTTYTLTGDGARFARVTAVNAGGESPPSTVVGGVPTFDAPAQVLVVEAYRRFDGTMLFHEDLSAYDLATIDRAYEQRINDGTQGARHGLALAAGRYSFDVASVEAVRRGEVALADYAVVDWVAAKDLTPTADDAALLATYLDGGGKLIVSGTDAPTALAPLADRFGATVAADDAGTYLASGFDLPLAFDDAGPGGYDADAPDALAATTGTAALTYDTGATAGVLTERTALLGFPIELVANRAELVAALLASLAIEPDLPEGGDTVVTDGGGCCSSSRGGPSGAILLALVTLLALRRRAT